MLARSSIATALAAAVLALTAVDANAWDDSKYPNWKGQWRRYLTPGLGGQGAFDQTRLWGKGQEAPLTEEYRKVHEASMADQAKGGLGNYPSSQCLPGGMPRMLYFGQQEYVITPDTTYMLLGGGTDNTRRVFTDGRDWPEPIEPTFQGYSIGRWIDTQGSGQYDVLEVETRGFKGPRAFDASGLPLAFDNQSIFKERMHLDRADPNVWHDEITVIDHALTRPWTSDRKYLKSADARPTWPEGFCTQGNTNIVLGKENYIKSPDGFLMPAKKDQAPPDLKYFNKAAK
jgi:hypothetical protein